MEAEERPTKKRRLSKASPEATGIESSRDAVESGKSEPAHMSNGVELSSRSDEDELCDQTNGQVESDAISQDALPAPEESAPIVSTINPDGTPMSKNQQKKLRKDLEWESKRDERKIKRKQQTIAKRERKREKRQQLLENGTVPDLPQPSRSKAVQLPITILIDCDFDDLMRDPERKSLATQITRSYSDNRHSPYRAHLAVCSFTGQLRERFDNVLSHYKGWKDVRFLDCDFVEAAENAKEWMLGAVKGGKLAGAFSSLDSEDDQRDALKEQGEVVYLTSESDETLTELKPYSTYIIGGLVDKNREKGICYKRARGRGVKTARLPIGDFMDMQSRKVLATNHVNEIMLKWLDCGDWGEAFMKVIPKRKGGALKAAEEDDVQPDVEAGAAPSEGADCDRGDDGSVPLVTTNHEAADAIDGHGDVEQ